MVRALRWLGGGLLALLGLVLALLLTWALTQGPDAEPRPLPAALQLPPPTAPTPLFQRVQTLLTPDEGGPITSLHEAPLGCGRAEDCATTWQRDPAAVAAQLEASARLGTRCEATLAAARDEGPYLEWLPEQLGPSQALPMLQGLLACQRWFIGQALVAAASSEQTAAQARLQQSHDWALLSLRGARSLIGHEIAVRQGHGHLQAAAAVALLQPDWSGLVETLVPPWPDELLDPARWMPVEAALGRGAIDELESLCQEASHPGYWLCRHRIGWHPRATRQQFDSLWLARIERLRDGPQAWLEASRARSATTTATAGDEPLPWAWRNTLGVLMVGTGQHDALYDGYIASPLDLALHRQLLSATLALRRAGVAPAERAAWLTGSGLLPSDLLARVRWEPDGRALRWQTWDADLRGEADLATARTPSRVALEPGP